MGEFVFVPGSDFNQTGDSPSGKFSINIDQLCNPYYKLMLGVDGALVDYQYYVYTKDASGESTIICYGSFTNNGSSEQICVGSPFVPGQTYYIKVNYTSNAVIAETLSFEAISCNTAIAIEYCCNAGLRIINAPQTSGTVTISKGGQIETVSYPFVTEVYLEDGEYDIDFSGVATATLGVFCNRLIRFNYGCIYGGRTYMYSFISTFVDDVPGDTYFVSSVKCDLGYPDIVSTINIYDNANVLLHSQNQIAGPSSSAEPYTEIYLFNISNTVPQNNTQYRVEILSTLSSLSYLGVFNNFITDTGYVFTTFDCPNDGNSNQIKITNIRCDPNGILVDIEALGLKTIQNIEYSIRSANDTLLYENNLSYGDNNPKRTILLPSSSFGGCMNNWYLWIELILARDFANNLIYFHYDKIYIPELFKSSGCLKCNWKLVCLENPST